MSVHQKRQASSLLACVAFALVLTSGTIKHEAEAMDPLSGLIGGMTSAVSDLTGGALGGGGAAAGALSGGLLGGSGSLAGVAGKGGLLPNVLSSAGNMVNGVTGPMMGLLGQLTSGAQGGLGSALGGTSNLLGDTLRMTTGGLNGLTSGTLAGVGLGGPGGAAMAGNPNMGTFGLHNAIKREAIASNLQYGGPEMAAAAAAGSVGSGETSAAIEAGAHFGAQPAVAAAAADSVSAQSLAAAAGAGGVGDFGMQAGANFVNSGAPAAAAAANAAILSSSSQAAGAGMMAAAVGSGAENAIAASNLATQNAAINSVAANQMAGRSLLAGEALRNAQAESTVAGADMVAHGANNARSASLASNAYRQAKLASARDRVNIAGTIQNSARISDAAIATHDAATRAEDSLLGSELAVDSASTVLDSDGAYIPPVTSSLLRSLPYGRLGVRNIIPKPLTYPSTLLPDVWLNGVPVSYVNVPMRMLPYTIGSTAATNPLYASGASLANGQIINGQPFIANNGMMLNGMVVDPAMAYIAANGAAFGIGGAASSSILPILANGQLEAQDEVAAANLVTMQQLGGAGMSATYQGYGRLNPVPMITGSVSENNLLPTTTVGTTYPIGSALVIEPRDSFFQDYVDNASSRQNFDEREQ